MRKIYAIGSILGMLSLALVARGLTVPRANLAAKIGSPPADFTLQDQNGKSVSLKDFSGKIVVLEWTNPQCPFVQRHYREKTMVNLAAEYAPRNVVWIAINSTSTDTNSYNKQWADSQHIPYPILNDASGTVGKAYGATNTPEMYIIGTDGNLLYKGAIDNDPQGEKATQKATNERINYVHQALDQILSGQPVSTPETKPYGCNVKYGD